MLFWAILTHEQRYPMDRTNISFWLSIASFVTSSILALIKILEFYWARRTVFTADVRLTTSDEIGNDILLLNKSSIPATITYFELVWTERRIWRGIPIPFKRKNVYADSPIEPTDGFDTTVAPNAVLTLAFTEADHFRWGGNGQYKIWLHLWLAGRKRPVELFVTESEWTG